MVSGKICTTSNNKPVAQKMWPEEYSGERLYTPGGQVVALPFAKIRTRLSIIQFSVLALIRHEWNGEWM